MRGLHPDRGVTVVRRDFIRMSMGALGVLLLGGCKYRHGTSGALTWEQFTEELVPRAEALLAQKMNEEDYIAKVVESLRGVDVSGVTRKNLPDKEPVDVAMFDLTKGNGFRHHDHRDYNGVILVMKGTVVAKNYDIVEGDRRAPAGRKIKIRETVSGTFGEGDFSTLSTTRDNIHDVRGGDAGCRLLDIFTHIGPKPRSVYLKVADQPLEERGIVYEASFTS